MVKHPIIPLLPVSKLGPSNGSALMRSDALIWQELRGGKQALEPFAMKIIVRFDEPSEGVKLVYVRREFSCDALRVGLFEHS